MAPEVLSEHLGTYLEGLTSTIISNQGTVDKFMGDAIMAFWGAPRTIENHATMACETALRCVDFLMAHQQQWQNAGLPSLKTRFGINTGQMIVGNMGYSERLSYTAIGDHVNLASRLEGLNRHYGTSILISEFTRVQLVDRFALRPIDLVAVKGKTNGVLVYELAGRTHDISTEKKVFLERFTQAFELYRAGKWRPALDALLDLAQLYPEDKPTSILRERCAGFVTNPPAEDWNGVIAMSSK